MAHNITSNILSPIQSVNRYQVLSSTALSQVIRQYGTIATDHVNAVMQNNKTLESWIMRSLKSMLYTHHQAFYSELLKLTESIFPNGDAASKVWKSEESIAKIQSEDDFTTFMAINQPQLLNLQKQITETRRASLEGFALGYVPSIPAPMIGEAYKELKSFILSNGGKKLTRTHLIDWLKSNWGAELSDKAGKELDADIIQDTFEALGKIVEDFHYEKANLTTVDLVALLSSHELGAAIPLQADYDQVISQDGMQILPFMATGDVGSGFSYNVNYGWSYSSKQNTKATDSLATDSLDEGQLEGANFEGLKQIGVADILVGILLATGHKRGLSAHHSIMPSQSSPLYAYQIAALSELVSEMMIEPKLRWFEVLRDLAHNPNRQYKMTTLIERFDDAITHDTASLASLVEDFFQNDLSNKADDIIMKMMEKRGVVQPVIYAPLEPLNLISRSTPEAIRNGELVRVDCGAPILRVDQFPVRTPKFDSSAVVLQSMISNLIVEKAVPGTEANAYINDIFSYEELARDNLSFDMTLAGLSTRLNKMATGPMYDVLKAKTTDLTLTDLVPGLINKQESDIVLLSQRPVEERITLIKTTLPITKSTTHFEFVTRGVEIGCYKPLIGGTYNARINSFMAKFAERIFNGYAAGHISKIQTEELKFERTYENLPYHKRFNEIDSVFIEYKLDARLFRFVSNPHTAKVAQEVLTSDFMSILHRHTMKIQRITLTDLKQHATQVVARWASLYQTSAIINLLNLLSGDLTVEERNKITLDPLLGAMVQMMTQHVFKKGKDAAPLALIYASEILKQLDELVTNKEQN